jgi:hypothetical protein
LTRNIQADSAKQHPVSRIGEHFSVWLSPLPFQVLEAARARIENGVRDVVWIRGAPLNCRPRRACLQVRARKKDEFLPNSGELLRWSTGFEQSSANSRHDALQHVSDELAIRCNRLTGARQHFHNRFV